MTGSASEAEPFPAWIAELRTRHPDLEVHNHPGGPVVRPRSTDQVAAVMSCAHEHGGAVRPGRPDSGSPDLSARDWSARDWGLPGDPPPADLWLDLTALNEVVQYEPADLTLTVGAGITLADLDEITRPHQQWLPLDPPGPSHLGGALAAARTGPLRTGFGGPRDLVLGATVVTGDGRILPLGGRVVKNVAGFDLLKLMVGGWGTFGVMTEATVRLYPRPSLDQTLVFDGLRPDAAVHVARSLATAPVVPAALDLWMDEAGARVRARACADAATATAELGALQEAVQAADGPAASPPQRVASAEAGWARADASRTSNWLLQGGFLPSDLGRVATAVHALADRGWTVQILPYDGLISAWHDAAPGRSASDDSATSLDAASTGALTAAGLEWLVIRAPRGGRAEVGKVGTGRADRDPGVARLIDRLHQAFDPHAVLRGGMRRA